MPDKLIITIPKISTEYKQTLQCRIKIETHNKLIILRRQTGLNTSELIQKCVDFAIDKIEIIEEE